MLHALVCRKIRLVTSLLFLKTKLFPSYTSTFLLHFPRIQYYFLTNMNVALTYYLCWFINVSYCLESNFLDLSNHNLLCKVLCQFHFGIFSRQRFVKNLNISCGIYKLNSSIPMSNVLTIVN